MVWEVNSVCTIKRGKFNYCVRYLFLSVLFFQEQQRLQGEFSLNYIQQEWMLRYISPILEVISLKVFKMYTVVSLIQSFSWPCAWKNGENFVLYSTKKVRTSYAFPIFPVNSNIFTSLIRKAGVLFSYWKESIFSDKINLKVSESKRTPQQAKGALFS